MRLTHWMIVITLTLTALGMHLWRLGEPARLMGDEWYFVQDAQRYVQQRLYNDVHPPLGKLQIALAIAAFGDSPWSWRISNAITGAVLILVMSWVTWLLTKHPRAVVLIAALVWLDGFVLTESRTAMINLPYVVFGFAAVGCILTARQAKNPRRWLILAGLAIGLAVSVKWLALLIIIPAIGLWWWPELLSLPRSPNASKIEALAWLGGLPVLVYLAVFSVHFLWLGSSFAVIKAHAVILANSFGVDQTGHPYREMWWRWPLLWQPFPYWSEIRAGQLSSVWSMPNPGLWWIGWAVFLSACVKSWRQPTVRLVLLFGLCSWLPFVLIRRDMFLYHALPMSLWLSVLLAVIASQAWSRYRLVVVSGLVIVVLSFVWWWPWFMNRPLSSVGHQQRSWLPAWELRAPEFEAIQRDTQGRPATL